MIKRAFDILVSSMLLILLSPLMLVIAAVIYYFLGSPIYFIQQRPGKSGQPFSMIKYRTMLNVAESGNISSSDELRLTGIGKFLRATSLDELPELWNVLKGDMSLVGPRPLLMEYLPLYTNDQMRRHDVLPGITGLAQVSGRNSLSWEEKFKLDVWYVDNKTFLIDLKILWLTIFRVFSRKGINQKDHATVEKFKGTH